MIALLFLLACSPQPQDTLGTDEVDDTASASEECGHLPLTSTATYNDVVALDADRCLAVQTADCDGITRIVHGDDGLFPSRSYYSDDGIVSSYSGSDQPGECTWYGPETDCWGSGVAQISTACVASTVYSSFRAEQELPYTPGSQSDYMENHPCHGQGQCVEPDGTLFTIIAPHSHDVFGNEAAAVVYTDQGEPVAFFYQFNLAPEGGTWFGQMVPSCLGAALEPSDACGLSAP